MDTFSPFGLVAAFFLILANGFFVAAEFSLVSARRTRIEELVQEGRKAAIRVKNLLSNMDNFLSTCQVCMTLCSLLLGWIGEGTFADLFLRFFSWLQWPPEGAVYVTSHTLATVLALLCLTYLHVILGELTPKTLALHSPEVVAMWISWPMQVCNSIFFPFVWTFKGSLKAMLKLLGLKEPPPHARIHSEEELGIIFDESHKAGMMSPEERKMLERVFQFHDKTVKEIMIPRPDITAMNVRATPKEVEKLVLGEGFSRLPVYDGNMDNVKGIVYVKDLIYPLQHPEVIKLADLLREAIFVPESYPVQKMLKDFQKARVHMAIVLDEFGATAGLVTLEDIVEEIVGEIQDEHDNEPAEVEKTLDGTIVIEGKASVDKLKEVFPDCELPEGKFDTVGGLVFHVAGHVPREGESFKVGNMVLRVTKREGRRLKKIAARMSTGQTQVLRNPVDATETAQMTYPEPVDSKREA